MSSVFAPDTELSGVRVLVVDDEPDVVDLTALLLSSFGLHVLCAHSGNEAFDLFVQQRPDVILSDIEMPDGLGDGLTLIRRIRALPVEQGGLTPAIAVSAPSSAWPF